MTTIKIHLEDNAVIGYQKMTAGDRFYSYVDKNIITKNIQEYKDQSKLYLRFMMGYIVFIIVVFLIFSLVLRKLKKALKIKELSIKNSYKYLKDFNDIRNTNELITTHEIDLNYIVYTISGFVIIGIGIFIIIIS